MWISTEHKFRFGSRFFCYNGPIGSKLMAERTERFGYSSVEVELEQITLWERFQ